jgi:sarcosine oxidase subunit beta
VTTSKRCVVVGAGITGLAIARELQARGRDVVVLERTGIGAGASGVQPGGVPQQRRTRIPCPLAVASPACWSARSARRPPRIPGDAAARLPLCRAERQAGTIDRERDAADEQGVLPIVTPDEAAELVPGLRTDAIVGGSWCGEDGYFDRPQSVVAAFAEGLDVRQVNVQSVDELDADVVVLAAGAETRTLLEPLGVDLPVLPEDRYLFLSDPIEERLLDPLVVAPELAFAAKHLADGRVLASDLGGRGDPVTGRDRWRARSAQAS